MSHDRVTVAVGAAAGDSRTTWCSTWTPQHPATHGVLRLRLTLDGDRIVDCEPIVGYMHRGVEKLFEVRDYRQIIVLANRHDWLSAFSSELGVVLAVERMLGMEVPAAGDLDADPARRAQPGAQPPDVPRLLPDRARARSRRSSTRSASARPIQAVMEEVSGGRMHYMFNRVGGLKEDLPAGWLDRVAAAVAAVGNRLAADRGPDLRQRDLPGPHPRRRRALARRWSTRTASADRSPGRPASTSTCAATSPTWPTTSCCADGVAAGARPATEGDCYARFGLLLDQVKVSLDLAEACVDRLRVARARPGERPAAQDPQGRRRGATYAWTENPLGINGYYLVSRGEKTPWRMKLRSASFNNVAVLPEVVAGCRVADLVAILGSMFFVVGDIDK